ncbi:carboxypeptidase-like regulatory domain-containing protein, partial [Mucilaginibacter sp. 5C4]
MKKIYLLLLLVSFLALTANSKDIFLSTKIPNVIDVAITGTIIDSVSGKPVDYATIAVFEQGTGKIVSGSMADAGGKFTVDNLVAGTYKLKITFIGYADKTVSNIQITEGGSLKLGKILLSPSATALKEVQVTAKKALIEEKIDRTVYN